jgi:hypothetical protein
MPTELAYQWDIFKDDITEILGDLFASTKKSLKDLESYLGGESRRN